MVQHFLLLHFYFLECDVYRTYSDVLVLGLKFLSFVSIKIGGKKDLAPIFFLKGAKINTCVVDRSNKKGFSFWLVLANRS